MIYIVELEAPMTGSMLVQIGANTAEEAVEKAEDAWNYEPLSVGLLPPSPTAKGHGTRGEHMFPVTVEKTKTYVVDRTRIRT